MVHEEIILENKFVKYFGRINFEFSPTDKPKLKTQQNKFQNYILINAQNNEVQQNVETNQTIIVELV